MEERFWPRGKNVFGVGSSSLGFVLGFHLRFGNLPLCVLYSSLFSILVKLLIVFTRGCKQVC